MSKKGENIYKRKDGRWEGRYIQTYDFSGKAKYGYVYAKTYTELKKKLLERQTAEKDGKMQNCQHIQYDNIIDSWLFSVKLKVKESTLARYIGLIDRHIRPALGNYDIRQISTELLEQYTVYLRSDGRLDGTGGLSAKTVTDILIIIKSTMKYAVSHGYSVNCQINQLSIKKDTHEMRVLSVSEQTALLGVLLYNLDLFKLGVLICLYTGIRIGELCALRWEHIILADGILEIRDTMQRIQDTFSSSSTKTKIICTKPKTRQSVRDIPIPKWLIEFMEPFQAMPKAYLLTGCTDTWVEPRTMQNHFKRYVEEAKIEHANFHSLRHTFATRCVELGFDI
ncbi:MAG: tyrosine-type recombinase/integrase, partial [Lachnospiraceae bacterium]